MNDLGLTLEDKKIAFAQLLGMRDYITYPLGNVQIKTVIFTPVLLYDFINL